MEDTTSWPAAFRMKPDETRAKPRTTRAEESSDGALHVSLLGPNA